MSDISSTSGRLTALALAGLAHAPNATLETGAPVDTLALPGGDAGRDLLLRAGALAIYRAAGRLPARHAAPQEPAPGESRPTCPAEAAALIEGFIVTNRDDLLLEALARLDRRGDLLPPALLPAILHKAQAFTTREMRAALAGVIGERGRWLARHNPAWSWALERTLPGERDSLPPDAETIWQEGSGAQRVELLARLRAHSPAQAREWLEAVWKKEKAETRAALLNTYSAGLSMEDEPFLESSLDDRSEKVRAVAAQLLTSLPGSALAQRIGERAGATLAWTGSALDANPPTAVDASWARDGLPAQSIQNKKGQRALWLESLLARVDPTRWTERFGVGAAEIIAASAASPWRASLLLGWSTAATDFARRDWAAALWDVFVAMPDKEMARLDTDRASYCRPLAPLVPVATLEALALRLVADPAASDGIELYEALDFLPAPWSIAFASAYLDGLRAFAAALTAKSRSFDNWDATLGDAARAIPEAAFAAAREPVTLPDLPSPYFARFRHQLDTFAETIRLRERLVKVLPE